VDSPAEDGAVSQPTPPSTTQLDPAELAGVRRGPLQPGERVTLTDPKGRRHSILLATGTSVHTAKGGIAHDELIGGPEGVVVRSTGGVDYLALRPLLGEFIVAMPRGAAVVYPKDAAQIVMSADIFPGARVVEAGVGSGALSAVLLRAVGPTGRLVSYERREDFALIARKNVENFLGRPHPGWDVRVGDLVESLAAAPEPAQSVDRVMLDMLAPWECVDTVAELLVPGGMVCCYLATTTQLARTVETLRVHGGFTEPESSESLVRSWHVEGLAVRPKHAMVGHTGFLVTARRLAPGVTTPLRKRRPAPGAYGEDYTGPR
jgi:tRNA (adenine57-N1/adenine58-N1)-methyltransferase